MREFDLIELGVEVGDTVYEMGQKPWIIWNIREGKRPFCIDIEDDGGEREVITNLGQYSDDMLPQFFPNRFEISDAAFEKPRPELAVDTPIWVRDEDNDSWLPKHFARWCESGNICAFEYGLTSHSGNANRILRWKQYRLTDPKEGE